MSLKKVIAITGCDSGLGWAIAARAAREGLITVAGMHDGVETNAAKALSKLTAYPVPLEVTDQKSIEAFRDCVCEILKKNPEYRLYALVNNAGTMTVGDFEWLTTKMMETTVNVNLLGPMKVTSAFLPYLRQTAKEKISIKPRVINIASHCGVQCLPAFSVYGASKAGLISWTSALRYELSRYGVTTVSFLPGGFVSSSQIMMNQKNHAKTMLDNLSDEQRSVYESRILSMDKYLSPITDGVTFDSMLADDIVETLMKAIKAENPKELYVVESWRYKIYYFLIKLPLPEIFKHWLINKFINLP